MKRLFYLLGGLLLVLSTIQAAVALDDSNLVAYWSFDDNTAQIEDVHTGLYNFTKQDSPVYDPSGFENGAWKTARVTGEFITNTNFGTRINATTDFCLSTWNNYTAAPLSTGQYSWDFVFRTAGGNYPLASLGPSSGGPYNDSLLVGTNDGSGLRLTSIWEPQRGAYHHYVWCRNEADDLITIWEDGVVVINESTSVWSTGQTSLYLEIQDNSNGDTGLTTVVGRDEMALFNTMLHQGDVDDLYNGGAGCFYSCLSGSGPAPTNDIATYQVTITDLYDDGALAGVNVTWAAGCYNLTDGAGVARTSNESCAGLTGSINWAAELSGYFSLSGSLAENGTTTQNMSAGHYNITSITELVTGDVLGPALGTWEADTDGGKTYSGGGTAYPVLIYLADGNNNITLSYTGAADYYPLVFEVNITAPESDAGTVAGVYDALWLINASNAYTGNPILNFTINATNTTEGYTWTGSTTNGTLYVPAIQGVGLNLLIDAEGYALDNATLIPDNSTPTHQFDLYTNNSLWVNAYDAETYTLIVGTNLTIVITGNSSEDTYTTTTGTLFVQNLTDGEYSVKLSGGNYTLRTYSVTVAERSFQTLNAYLERTTSTVIFTILDADSGSTIEGCSMGAYRLINGSYTLVESKNTDITGRAQFTYTVGIKYRFDVSCTGYDFKSFFLDPVIFASYNVLMTRAITISDDQDYMGVTVAFSPKAYANNQTTTFNISFLSPGGTLETYNYTVTLPNGSVYTDSGTNANGESFSQVLSIVNATYPSYVIISYSYDTSIGLPKTYTKNYLVGDTVVEGSWLNMQDYGLGTFEKVLIAVMVIIVIGGLAMAANLLAGMAFSLLILGFFVYIGFIPLWGVLITFLIGVIVLSRRSS